MIHLLHENQNFRLWVGQISEMWWRPLGLSVTESICPSLAQQCWQQLGKCCKICYRLCHWQCQYRRSMSLRILSRSVSGAPADVFAPVWGPDGCPSICPGTFVRSVATTVLSTLCQMLPLRIKGLKLRTLIRCYFRFPDSMIESDIPDIVPEYSKTLVPKLKNIVKNR